MTRKFRVLYPLANGEERHLGDYPSREEAKKAILAEVGTSRQRRRSAATHIDDDGLFFAGWDFGIFELKDVCDASA